MKIIFKRPTYLGRSCLETSISATSAWVYAQKLSLLKSCCAYGVSMYKHWVKKKRFAFKYLNAVDRSRKFKHNDEIQQKLLSQVQLCVENTRRMMCRKKRDPSVCKWVVCVGAYYLPQFECWLSVFSNNGRFTTNIRNSFDDSDSNYFICIDVV